MRRKKLKAYWTRLKELQKREKLTRDQLLLAIGAAKQKSGRNAHRLLILHLPASGKPVKADTFRIELDRKKTQSHPPPRRPVSAPQQPHRRTMAQIHQPRAH